MKQETGRTDAPHAGKRVSIQQSLDGRSFSMIGAEGSTTAEEKVEVELRTWQTMLVPVEVFDPDHAEALLAAAGMACTATQQAVWTPRREDEEAVAVMAIGQECRQQLEERFGSEGQILYTTPLLHTPQGAERYCVWLRAADDILYIKVYDRGLRLAEAIPLNTEDDPLYLIERLNRMFPLREFDLRIAGPRPRALRKTLGRYFRSSTCE